MSSERRPNVEGYVAPGFDRVLAAFQENFEEESEVGASFAVVRDGELIVDLWGGIADRQAARSWSNDTLQMIFSGSKGLVACILLMLIDRGLIDLSQSVSLYWPEFGKDEIRVRDIVSHGCRMPGIEMPVSLLDLADDMKMASILADQLPSEDARAARCYHPLTWGWLCGELVRRVSGRSVGQFFAEELAAKLNLELWIGLPEKLGSRMGALELAHDWGSSWHLDPATWAKDALVQSIWGNPAHFAPDHFPWNKETWRAAEIPSTNAIGTARAVAEFYGALVGRGASLVTKRTLKLGLAPLADWIDPIHGGRRRFGVGFALQSELKPFGPPSDAFGHNGAGGSSHGAWPSHRLGYSYLMNLMRDDGRDKRAARLLTALHDAL